MFIFGIPIGVPKIKADDTFESMAKKTDAWIKEKRSKFDLKNAQKKKISKNALDNIRKNLDNIIIKHREYILNDVDVSERVKVERNTTIHFFYKYEERPINNAGLAERNSAIDAAALERNSAIDAAALERDSVRNLKLIANNSSIYTIEYSHDYNIKLGKNESPRFPYKLSNSSLITNINFESITTGESLSNVINLLGNNFNIFDENAILDSILMKGTYHGKIIANWVNKSTLEIFEHNKDADVYVWVASIDGHDNVSSLNTEGNGRIKAVAISVVSRNGIVVAKGQDNLRKNKG